MYEKTEITDKNEHQSFKIEASEYQDKWGPKRVVHVYDDILRAESILVIDNVALGPGCTGVRLSSTVTPLKIFQLARATTWKSALADIPFGGAMIGIKTNPDEINKIAYIKSFAKKFSAYVPDECIVAPEMNTGAEEMAAFAEALGNYHGITGKPERMGGIPYELGTISFGIGVAIETVVEVARAMFHGKNISNTTIALCGFDMVGSGVAKYLATKNAKIVAISDSWGCCYNPKGLDISRALKRACATGEKKSIKRFKPATAISKDDFLSADCDVLVITGCEEIVGEKEANIIGAKCVVEGANGLLSSEAEQILYKNGVLVIPDILATTGGIIASYAECNSWSPSIAFSVIESKIAEKTKFIIMESLEKKIPPRSICVKFAQERIDEVVKGEE